MLQFFIFYPKKLTIQCFCDITYKEIDVKGGISLSSEFTHYHPLVSFIYFLAVIGFTMASMNPTLLLISVLSAFIYSVMLRGSKEIKRNLLYMLPIAFFLTILNPVFNHQGVTIIAYFPNGEPLTLEAIIYGFISAFMVSAVICWFSSYNFVMTSDKFMYLFGRFMPSVSLIFSMTLRFVPQFTRQLKSVSEIQKTIGCDTSSGSISQRIKNGVSVISTVVGWSLENAIDTADSMKSRGYGLFRRTSFSIFTFSTRDAVALFSILFLSVYILVALVSGKTDFQYFPSISGHFATPYTTSVYVAFTLLYVMPIIIELWEATRWKFLRRKI